MATRKVQLRVGAYGGGHPFHLSIDGMDLSGNVEGFELVSSATGITRLRLDLVHIEVTAEGEIDAT